MTFDPTTNRIPFGLLTPEEQDALEAWPHGWEIYESADRVWRAYDGKPSWLRGKLYRGKPAPKVNSYWFNVYGGARVASIWSSQEAASSNSHNSVLMRMDICNGEVTVTKETN